MEYIAHVTSSMCGDIKSYEYLVEHFQSMAIAQAYSILHDFQLAEDAAQEAFILLYYNIRNLKEPAAFITWLRKIVFSCCTRIIRGKKDEVPYGDYEASSDGSEVTDDNEKRSLVEKALLSLKREQQEVFVLYYIYGRSYQEIAIQLEVTESTVANRLYSGKRKLKDIMLSTMAEYIGGRKMEAGKFTRKVLDQVPHIIPQNSDIQENFYFCAAMRACAQYFKQDAALDFIFFAGVTGSLFCNVWAHNPKWDYVEDITGCGGASERDAAVEAAFRALGYRCEIVGEDKLKSDIAHYKRKVVDSLDKGLPVLTYGIVGYPCCSLITGYDDNGDVLIGWSKFQDDSAADDLPDGFEPCGYFRKRNGLSNSHGLIFFGEKSSVPDLRDDYKRALLNIVNTSDLEKNDKLLFGADAYSAWADALECDADFPIDDINTLVSRLDSHSGPLLIVLTGRMYASEFLSRAVELVPEWRTDISEAISLYNEERDTLFGILGIQGGFSNSDREIALRLADPAVRRQIAGIIRTARDLDNKAVECFRRCL